MFPAVNNVAAKCVYDERMFSKDEDKLNVDTTDPEDDYFQIMKNMNTEQRTVIFYSVIVQYFFQKLLIVVFNNSYSVHIYSILYRALKLIKTQTPKLQNESNLKTF